MGTELCVLGSSSSSSSSDDEETKKQKEEKAREELAKKAEAEKKNPLGPDGVWDVDQEVKNNTLDVEAYEAAVEQRKKRRKENTKILTTEVSGGCCPVPGCVRHAGHDPPHLDVMGNTLLVKVQSKNAARLLGQSKKKRTKSSSSSSSEKKKN